MRIFRAPGLTARRRGGMSSLDVPRVKKIYVVAFLLFGTGIGYVLVSGEASSHIKNLNWSQVTIEAEQTVHPTIFRSRHTAYAPDLVNPISLPILDSAVKSNAFSREGCKVQNKTYAQLHTGCGEHLRVGGGAFELVGTNGRERVLLQQDW
jgi:hypothetical protein